MHFTSVRQAMPAAMMAGALALAGCHKAGETAAGAAPSQGLAGGREQAPPRAAPTGTTLNAGSGADAVSIREDAGGTHIQAGDVTLDTGN